MLLSCPLSQSNNVCESWEGPRKVDYSMLAAGTWLTKAVSAGEVMVGAQSIRIIARQTDSVQSTLRKQLQLNISIDLSHHLYISQLRFIHLGIHS